MLKKVLLGVAALLVGAVIVVALQPAEFRVERSIAMAAPPAAAHAQVNDFRRWSGWSPWEKRDPGMKRAYEGAPSGVGAKYAWLGNDQVGEGRMTITKSEPSAIVIELVFLKPFAATNTATFTFTNTPTGNQTTWVMQGRNHFAGKAFGLFMDMDALVGADFERGLVAMKAAAEAASTPPPVAATTP